MKNKQNKVVNEIDLLKNELDAVILKMMEVQRQQDLKVDIVNKKYENKKDALIRRKEFIEMQMEQAKEYAKKNLKGANNNE